MSIRPATTGEHGYRIVFGNGLVWLVRRNGTPVCVSTWQPTCLAQSVGAGAALATIAAADERARS